MTDSILNSVVSFFERKTTKLTVESTNIWAFQSYFSGTSNCCHQLKHIYKKFRSYCIRSFKTPISKSESFWNAFLREFGFWLIFQILFRLSHWALSLGHYRGENKALISGPLLGWELWFFRLFYQISHCEGFLSPYQMFISSNNI